MSKDIFIKILKQSKNSNNLLIFDKNIKYKDFYNLSFKYFNFFKKINLKKNNVICLKMHYSIDFISLIFAAYLNKNPITILNPNCTDDEQNHVLKSSKSRIIFFNNKKEKIKNKILLSSEEISYQLIKAKDLKILNSDDRFLIFTSGTTSKPKGAILTTNSFSNNILSISENLKLNSFDKTLIFSPPAYAMGISQIFSFMNSGSKISFYNDGLKFPAELVNKIQKLKITRLNISVSAFKIIHKYIDNKSHFYSIKTVMSGGMPH